MRRGLAQISGRWWRCLRLAVVGLASVLVFLSGASRAAEPSTANVWPAPSREARPWTYWWWMGSAVDQTNLTRELERYQKAGLGGVHIIPIYGARGFEDRFIDYLSPKWMELLDYTVREAGRLGMGVDMTTGSGWCFGGPKVLDRDANALAVAKVFDLSAGARLSAKVDAQATQALVAYSREGDCVELTERIREDGTVDWSPDKGAWRVYAVSQKASGQKVKRAGPGGQGAMLNLFYPEAMRHYLEWFGGAFDQYTGARPRAMYHDSYEYRCDWSPDLFDAFQKRRGYRLQTELPALFGKEANDRAARVKCDYRETISDVMAEITLPMWATWSRRHGFITRNEAHGSPGNLLDLYAAADIPETEMFYKDRNKLVSKFASSAAHVTGKNLAASETGTWLNEHFTETLAEMKYLLDDLFLSGINHVFYHGTCYSPDEAGWPGWHFYASFEMNPRNAIWRDAPALNAYAARCQAVLQTGQPDSDILLYWPIHDLWQNPAGMVRPLTVHARDWFEDQPFGKTAAALWNRGFAFDYISDRQLNGAKAASGAIRVPGGAYKVLVVPPAHLMPVQTMRKLNELAKAGATVIFEKGLPADVPGWGNLESRRTAFHEMLKGISLQTASDGLQQAKLGQGQVFVGDLESALAAAKVGREAMFDRAGLMCVRRKFEGGTGYFVANRSADTVKGWLPLGRSARTVMVMQPLTGATSTGLVRSERGKGVEWYAELEPGESILLRCLADENAKSGRMPIWEPAGPGVELAGSWRVSFIEGGPEIPAAFETARLASWTEFGGAVAQRFAGTARYCLAFNAPPGKAAAWRLDLGKVCQSARVRLNGTELGTLITPPFRVVLPPLKPVGNELEVEVTNVSANRIRDLDQRGIKWKSFYDINIVNLDYKPFDASHWPITDSGLIGPVTLTPLKDRTGELR